MKPVKIYLGIILGVLATVLVTFILLPSYTTNQNPVTDTTIDSRAHGETLRIAEVDLPGMFCPSCAWSAASAFKGMEGVVDAKVDFDTEKGTVIYNPNIVSKEQLVQNGLIQAYDGKILTDQKYNP